MTPEEISILQCAAKEFERLQREASPGPWTVRKSNGWGNPVIYCNSRPVATVEKRARVSKRADADAAFIAAARNTTLAVDLLRLVGEVERLRLLIDKSDSITPCACCGKKLAWHFAGDGTSCREVDTGTDHKCPVDKTDWDNADFPPGTYRAAERRAINAEVKVEQLRKQLPPGMEHCTIVFKECSVGHGRLTATNWVQHGCPTCERDELRAENARLKADLAACQDMLAGKPLPTGMGEFVRAMVNSRVIELEAENACLRALLEEEIDDGK